MTPGRTGSAWWGRGVILRGALLLAVAALAPGSLAAATDETVEQLKREIEALRTEYESRLAAMEQRLTELEKERSGAEEESAEVAALRRAALEAAGATAAAEVVAAETPDMGRERNLNRLNPEISMTGILRARTSTTEREEFDLGEFELDLQAALDPFSSTRWTIAYRDEEVEIEEGYLAYSSLPTGLGLLAGKFRQRFGPLNRQHRHALPQSDYPLAIQAYFGDEGLAQTGVSLSWLLATPWAAATGLTLEVTDGENEQAFAGESFDRLSVLGRLKNYWEPDDASYVEWGLSGIVGETVEGGDSRVWGSDLTYHWQPPARAKYRELLWRTELLLSQREVTGGERLDAWGGYTYLEGLLRRNLYAGIRLDRAEDALEPERYLWGMVPYLTWWQSEFVRLRGEYRLLEDDSTGERESRFLLELTWAAGPHKHSTY